MANENEERVNECLQVVIESLRYLKGQGFTIEDLIVALEEMNNSGDLNNYEVRSGAKSRKMDEVTLERRASEILHSLGMPANILGYRYTRTAIMIVYQDPEILDAAIRKLYPKVAQIYETTPMRVERAMRHAIEKVWDKGDLEAVQKYFSGTVNPIKGKATNTEFISMLVDYLNLYG